MAVARAASRRFLAGLAVSAGGLLAAACASVEAPRPQFDLAAMASEPAPRSTLITRRDLRFHLAVARRQDGELTVLVHETAAGHDLPVAVIDSSASQAGTYVSIQRLALPGGVQDSRLELAVLEHLYVQAVQQRAEAAFCLAGPERSCDARRHGESHGELLRELVQERERAVRVASDGKPGAPWRVVSMMPTETRAPDADHVAVRVALGEQPLEGANIYFSRAPHSGCVARTGTDGLATCELVDYHGDDGDADEGKTPVVATFSGDVRADRVLVPTTFVLPPGQAASLAKAPK